MHWLLIAVVVLGLVAWAWHRGMQPAPNDLDSPEAVLETFRYLLARGLDGGQARFQLRSDPHRYLVFKKYIVARNEVGFRSLFYEDRGLEHYFERLRQELSQRAIKHAEGRTKGGKRYLMVDYVRDMGLAQLVARLVFERVFEVRLERDCVAYFREVLISDEPSFTGVDAPKS